jgi:energy-coupling factor transporter ATP-binding protein EcfA2
MLLGFRQTRGTSAVGGVGSKSGSRKSTLINLIAGIDRPSSGEIDIAATPVHALPQEQRAAREAGPCGRQSRTTARLWGRPEARALLYYVPFHIRKSIGRRKTMRDEDLEDAFEEEIALRLYTSRIGRFVEGRIFALHWPAAPDAFLLEAINCRAGAADYSIYWVQRSDPSLIIKPT